MVRTTIEIKAEHRARLLEIAARRGEKGFSTVVREAIEVYLQEQARNEEIREKALRVGGSFNSKDTATLRRNVAAIRTHWR